jgi:mono/diheme cytochrome c family protein
MNQMVVRTTAIILPLIFAGFLLGAGESAPTTTVAQNKAKELFELACGGCHAVDLATSLRNSKEQWSEIVQSMIDKGAYIKKDEVATIVDYLTANYGLKQETPAPKEAPAAGGGTNPAASKDAEIQQLAEGACGGCHGYDLVSEKRG